ncbi:hypothetical protein [Stackebrandtia nassauensis]|uniref:Uncharacterized protein n=1 Tax=Stackebrandtia nassauensis (strain DSM 44728 / CIP 108903 / NRRL B-16338 / NBRC 102104 / LLR-40K-21) TaxID=446470 RepID=D3Q384_STANL|nr:hypothetical protein [Stackebrandtia nassauensis]ADD40054.1 hypothetical protein Snas_0336 [Stackebrandtia nassauensis DSM 44728]
MISIGDYPKGKEMSVTDAAHASTEYPVPARLPVAPASGGETLVVPPMPRVPEGATCLACLPKVKQLSAQLELVAAERDDLAAAVEGFREEVSTQKAQTVVARQQRDDLHDENQVLSQRLTEAEALAEEAVQARSTAEAALADTETLSTENTDLRSELDAVIAERDRLAAESKVKDDKAAKLAAAKLRAAEARKSARRFRVVAPSFVFYLICLSGALYGLVEVLHGVFGWDYQYAIPLGLALELAGIKFKLDADAQLDAGEDAKTTQRVSKIVAALIIGLNVGGHIWLIMPGQAVAFGTLSALGYLSWTNRSSFMRRLTMRAEGRADATHLHFTKADERQYGKAAVDQARQLAAADIAGELTKHEALQKGAEMVAAAEQAADDANRERRLVTLVRNLKRAEYPANPELADVAVARMRPQQLASGLMASDAEHAAMVDSILDLLENRANGWSSKLGTRPGTKTGTRREPGRDETGNASGPESGNRQDKTGTETGSENTPESGNENPVSPAESRTTDKPGSHPDSVPGTDAKPQFGPAPKRKVKGCPNSRAARAIGKHISMTGSKPSIPDIAKQFKVSTSTADRWINGVYDFMSPTANGKDRP